MEDLQIALQQQVGIYLAQGLDHAMILDILDGAQELGISEETGKAYHPFLPLSRVEAVKVLRAIYDSWVESESAIGITYDDQINWHVRQRMQLLRRSLKKDLKDGLRMSLAVLESLAKIQKLTDTTDEHQSNVQCEVQFVIPSPDVEAKVKDDTNGN